MCFFSVIYLFHAVTFYIRSYTFMFIIYESLHLFLHLYIWQLFDIQHSILFRYYESDITFNKLHHIYIGTYKLLHFLISNINLY